MENFTEDYRIKIDGYVVKPTSWIKEYIRYIGDFTKDSSKLKLKYISTFANYIKIREKSTWHLNGKDFYVSDLNDVFRKEIVDFYLIEV